MTLLCIGQPIAFLSKNSFLFAWCSFDSISVVAFVSKEVRNHGIFQDEIHLLSVIWIQYDLHFSGSLCNIWICRTLIADEIGGKEINRRWNFWLGLFDLDLTFWFTANGKDGYELLQITPALDWIACSWLICWIGNFHERVNSKWLFCLALQNLM